MGDDARMLLAFWAWHVDPNKAEAGWAPHRDRDRHSLYEDGRTKYLTIWLPITEANSLNGCIYMVPADRDRTYASSEELSMSFDHADIRALPAKPGEIYAWNHAVYHWGARAADGRDFNEPRISIAFEYADPEGLKAEKQSFDLNVSPSFKERKQYIAKQIFKYVHMTEFPEEVLGFARSCLLV